MAVIFTLNLCLHFYLFLYFPFYLSKKLGIGSINPVTIMAIMNWPVELMKRIVGPAFALENGLFNPYFNYAIFVESVSNLMTFFVVALFFRIKQRYLIGRMYYTLPLNMRCDSKHMKGAMILLFILFVINFILLAKSFGILNWIMDPRTGYQLHRTGNGMFYALAKVFLTAFIAIYLLYATNIRTLITRFVLLVPIAYLLGSKGYLLSMGIYLFIVLWFRRYKHQKRLYSIFLPIIFALMIFILKPDNIEDVVAYFDYYINSSNFYEAMLQGNLDYFGGKIFITDFWGLVPRSIYPDKPIIYGFLHVNEYFFPGAAEATNTPAFAGPVAAYADFGLAGVILTSVLNVRLWFSLYAYSMIFQFKTYKEIINHPITVALIVLYFAPQFLDFFGFPLNIIVYIIILLTICFGSRMSLKTNRNINKIYEKNYYR